MKKTITLSIAALSTLVASAQLPVSQTAGKKQVLLEEFTGQGCTYCPDGHLRSDNITNANPTKAFAINIHEGSFAGAQGGKDFKTLDGVAIGQWTPNLQGGWPKGSINRKPTTNPSTPVYAPPSGWTMNRGYWASVASGIMTENTFINLAGQATLNSNTKALTINMEAYYTAAAPSGSVMRITIALLQDNIIAPQTGASKYPAMQVGSNYRHNHALRDIISGAVTGTAMTGATTAGTKWTQTFNYTVTNTIPATGTQTIPVVLADLKLIAFVTTTSAAGDVVAVCKVPINITTDINDAAGADLLSNVNVYPNPMTEVGVVVFTLAQSNPVTISVVNTLGQTVLSNNLDALNAGEHKYELDATNLTNGIYFVNIKVGENTTTKKISILK